MKYILKLTTIYCFFNVFINQASAQIKFQTVIKSNQEDSLLNEFKNDIYYSFYNPSYLATKSPTFCNLKVDINVIGKVTDIRFSDSADSAFVKAYTNSANRHNEKATLEKYAEIKGLKNLSLIIPVSFEPDYPNQKKSFKYEELESLMKFNKISFYGNAIVLPAIEIKVTLKGNM